MNNVATQPPALSHRQILVIFSGLMLGMLLAALDQTIVSTALPTIVGELGGLNHLSWVVTAYLLTSTAATPLYGKISDLLGRKIVFQTAIVIFLVGSVLAGISQNMAELIAFRAIQGIGGGGLMAMAMAIIGDVVAPRERGRYQGYLGAVFAVSSVAGPLLGGFFTDHLSWRWVFYINVPLGLAALVVTGMVLNLEFRRVSRPIDYLGAILLVTAVTSVLLVTVWGGNQYPWSSPMIIGLGALGAVTLGLFIAQERRAVEPLMPLRLFANPVFRVAVVLMFLVGVAMFGTLVFLPLYLQIVQGVSATSSGLLLTPMMFGIIVSSTVSGRLISRLGRYRMFPILGTALMVIGFAMLTHLGVGSGRAETYADMIVIGLGIGLVMQVLVLACQNAVAYGDLGAATSSVSFFRSMGGSFGTAIFGSILTASLNHWIPLLLGGRLLPPGMTTATLQGSPSRLKQLPAPIHTAVAEAFAHSIHTVFLWAVPFAVLAFALSWMLREVPLRGVAAITAPSPEPTAEPEEPEVLAAATEARTAGRDETHAGGERVRAAGGRR